MTVYHIGTFTSSACRVIITDRFIVLFKIKPGTPSEKVEEIKAAGYAMVGQVPGE